MEGIIKFKANWENTESISDSEYDYINPWREICFGKSYIGVGEDGIGYGNISFRIGETNEFIISGSATGHITNLESIHYSRVTNFDINKNKIHCEGRTVASSESMSHAALYSSNNNVRCIIHIHNNLFWKKYINKLPTTNYDAEYGTVAMANDICNLAKELDEGAIIMGGHQDGIMVFGGSFNFCINLLANLG